MDAIFLDIDGTLWDSTNTVAEAWNKALSQKPEIQVEITPERLKTLFGKPLSEIAAVIFKEYEEKKQLELIELCCEQEHELLEEKPGIIFEGVVETIHSLAKKYPVCIISNCEAGYIELVMEKLGITDCITDFECPGYTGLSKGENCKLVMKRNNFKDVIYVGDTQGDYEATQVAGIPFVFCKYGFGTPDGYDYAIENFSDLLNLF